MNEEFSKLQIQISTIIFLFVKSIHSVIVFVITLVAIINSIQCLSLIDGFCKSVTARNDVIRFLIVPSIDVYGSLNKYCKYNTIKNYINCILNNELVQQEETIH